MLSLLHSAWAPRSEGPLQRLGEEALSASQSGKLTCQEESEPQVLLAPKRVCGARMQLCAPLLTHIFRISLPLSPRIWKSPSRISGR